MTKTGKKLDKQICQALTKVCEEAKDKVQGFQWLTHHINYQQFPNSLLITCVFDTRAAIEEARQQNKDHLMMQLINDELAQINIKFKDISKHVVFDMEEVCQ